MNINLCNKELTKLPKLPESVKGMVACDYNQLLDIVGSPRTVLGYFGCLDNKLISLKGGPKIVRGHFQCGYNKLTNLFYSPKQSKMIVARCNNLISLDYISGNPRCSI